MQPLIVDKAYGSLFLRPQLAAEMAQQLIAPGALDIGFRSGLFLSGLRRTGKTTFLLNDLIPALEDLGALIIYADLWSNAQSSPAKLVIEAVRMTLADLQTPASTVLEKFAKAHGVDSGAMEFRFEFELEEIGLAGTVPLAEALIAVVDQARTDVVLIIDEVQHAISSDDGNSLLYAIKAARDAINLRPDTRGHLAFIGAGSDPVIVSELATRRNQAFAGATVVPYPVLDQKYVEFLLSSIATEVRESLPSVHATTEVFKTMRYRPEELIRALRQLFSTAHSDPDEALLIIATTLHNQQPIGN